MRFAADFPGSLEDMTRMEWLAASDIAMMCGTDPQTVVRHLDQLGLIGVGAEASEMALRHDLAMESNDYSTSGILWHPDVITLLAATGLEKAPAEPRIPSGVLFGEDEADSAAEPVSAIDRARARAQVRGIAEGSAPADPAPGQTPDAGKHGNGADRDHASTPYVPGADKYGFDQVIATDGACSGNPGPGGWAWVDEIMGESGSGGAKRTTNNIMELTAMLEALRHADPKRTLLLRADSQYVINVVTKWAPGWRRKGWKKADGKPVANQELVAKLLEAYEAREAKTRIDWVRGHDGDAGNEEADRLAVKERDHQ